MTRAVKPAKVTARPGRPEVSIGGFRFEAESQLSDGADARVHAGRLLEGGSSRPAVLVVYKQDRDVEAIRAAMAAAAAGGVATPEVLAACDADGSPVGAPALLVARIDGKPSPLALGSP